MFCANCGKPIVQRKRRFSVCDCGYTQIADKSYIEFIKFQKLNNTLIFKRIELPSHRKTLLLVKNQISAENFIKNIDSVPIKDAKTVISEIATMYGENSGVTDFILSLNVLDAVVHMLQMQFSDVYSYLVKNRYYDIALAVIKSRRLLISCPSGSLSPIKRIIALFPNIVPQNIMIAYDAVFYQYSDDIIIQLSEIGFTAENFTELKQSTNFSDKEILDFVDVLQKSGFTNEEILNKIKKLYKVIKEINQTYGTNYESAASILAIHTTSDAEFTPLQFRAKNIKIIKQLKSIYSDKNPNFVPYCTSNGLTILPAAATYALKYCKCVSPEDTLTGIPFAIFEKSTMLDIAYIGKINIYLHSKNSDRIKKAVNEYLDFIEEAD